jgi:hypothetical protein
MVHRLRIRIGHGHHQLLGQPCPDLVADPDLIEIDDFRGPAVTVDFFPSRSTSVTLR